MTGTIFDLYEKDIPEGQEGYFEIAKNAPQPKDNSFYNDVKEYGKTILKGNVEGISRLGKAFGPLKHETKTQEQELEHQTETLNKLLPTEDTFGQKAVRRGLRELPTAVGLAPASAIQTIPRVIAAGFIGEGSKELGAPEWAQSALELTAYIGPDITKKLLSSGNDKELIEFAKKMGMTDKQITPLIQSDFKQTWLSKLSPKRGATQTALKDTKGKLDETYGIIQKSENASKEISEKANGSLINGIREKLNGMPAKTRDLIEKDLNDLLNNKITGSSLINFWKDINSHVGPESKELSLLKEPVKRALQSLSPELAGDFEMINKLYSKYYPIASKLRPNLATDIVGAAESIGLLGAFAFGHYPVLVSFVGEKVARKLAQQMLINPHFQQLSTKIIQAMNENKYSLVKKLSDQMANEIGRYSPHAAKELKKLSEKEIEEFLKSHD